VTVFKSLVKYFTIDYIKSKIIKRINELVLPKMAFTWRRIGYEMLCAIADYKGEDIFKAEPTILKAITTMCSDTNWKFRK